MFCDLLEKELGIEFIDKILIVDFENLFIDYEVYFQQKYDLKIYRYDDIEKFRYKFEAEIKNCKNKSIVILQKDIYVPYDIQQYFTIINISYESLFPRLNSFILKNYNNINKDLLAIAYSNLYENFQLEAETINFIEKNLFDKDVVYEYISNVNKKIELLLDSDNYNTWFSISEQMATIKNLKLKTTGTYQIDELYREVNRRFKQFILSSYKGLTGRNSINTPIVLSKAMDYILMQEKKFAIVVMDGMSVSDWQLISNKFNDIKYNNNYCFALIPTLTSISRQSLLSGKLPRSIESPFNLSREKNMFMEKCMEYGYNKNQIKYYRGYDIDVNIKDKCLAVIINDIDNLVHNQLQGYSGMYRDIEYMSNNNKLKNLICKLRKLNFDIYITSDHGNTNTKGIGKIKGSGIEVETKSKRAIIYKNYAETEEVKEQFGLIDYPGYYLPDHYKYYICEMEQSFGILNEDIMSHGGITLEEVIVPFIKIKGVQDE